MIEDEVALLKTEMAGLRVELARLQAEITDVGEALKSESTNNTKHFNVLYPYIADIYDYLMPVVKKVFPGYTAAKKQLDEFMEHYNARPIRKKPSGNI